MTSLQGKTLLVTGASSGIGRALCDLLVERGANVLGVTRRPSILSENVSPIVADLTQREQVSAIFQGLGKIDGLATHLCCPLHALSSPLRRRLRHQHAARLFVAAPRVAAVPRRRVCARVHPRRRRVRRGRVAQGGCALEQAHELQRLCRRRKGGPAQPAMGTRRRSFAASREDLTLFPPHPPTALRRSPRAA